MVDVTGALQAAISGRQINGIENGLFLLSQGADINKVQFDVVRPFASAVYSTALHAAIFVSNNELASFLVERRRIGESWIMRQ